MNLKWLVRQIYKKRVIVKKLKSRFISLDSSLLKCDKKNYVKQRLMYSFGENNLKTKTFVDGFLF